MKSTDHSTALVVIVCSTKRVLVLHYFIVPDDRYQATTFKIIAVLSDVYSSKENVTKNSSCKYFIVPRLLVPLYCQSFPRPFRIKVLRVLFSFEICGEDRLILLIVWGSSDEHSWKASWSESNSWKQRKKFVCDIHPLPDVLCERKHD